MKVWNLALAMGVMLAFGGTASAQEWPSRPITWVVPFAAGGVTDVTSRKIAAVLSQQLGQPVVVENKPGAGGIVGTETVASAKNDGYTLLYGSGGPLSILPSLQKGKLSFDPIKDFAYVRGVSSSSQLIVANMDAPYNTIPELVDYAKANPGSINFGSPGIGTAQHLAGELLKSAAGIDIMHIPYKAGTAQMVDLMSGVIDLSFEYTSVVKPYVDAGKMKVLGSTGPKRATSYPDKETVVEAGWPAAENVGWTAIALPAGTDPAIVNKLSEALDKAIADPSVQEFFTVNAQTSIADKGPEELTKFVAEENGKFEKLISSAKITAQ